MRIITTPGSTKTGVRCHWGRQGKSRVPPVRRPTHPPPRTGHSLLFGFARYSLLLRRPTHKKVEHGPAVTESEHRYILRLLCDPTPRVLIRSASRLCDPAPRPPSAISYSCEQDRVIMTVRRTRYSMVPLGAPMARSGKGIKLGVLLDPCAGKR